MKVRRKLVKDLGLLTMAFASGVFFLWGYWRHSPSAELMKKLRQQATEGQNRMVELKDDEIPRKRKAVAELREIYRDFQKTIGLMQQLRRMFPEKRKLGDLMDLLSRAAESDGVKVLRIKPDEPVDQGGWWEIPLRLELVCGLTQFQNYLISVERMPRFIRINSFDIDLVEEPLQVEVEIECSAFVVKTGATEDET